MAVAKNRVQVMLDDETLEALKEAAQNDSRTVSDYIRVLLKEHLNV